VFVRVQEAGSGTVVNVGGLARSDVAGGFETEFAELSAEIMDRHGGTPLADPVPAPTDNEAFRDHAEGE